MTIVHVTGDDQQKEEKKRKSSCVIIHIMYLMSISFQSSKMVCNP